MKRLDLQAIRGVAILLVLLFHLHPDTFSLGFIGVDMFFVLSGYLMAIILSREHFSQSSLWKFYSRRFKRIVPLYYIVLVMVYTATNFLLIHPDKKQLLWDIKWVLPFSGNIEPLFERSGYWDQVNKTRFFVHCWSLAVEIQFYLIAPFIIFASQQVSTKNRNVLLLLSIIISCSFQVLTPEKVSYGLLPSRIWQFLLGVLCFQEPLPDPGSQKFAQQLEAESLLEEKQGNPWTNNFIVTFIFLVALWNPDFEAKEHVARILSCFLIAYVIFLNSKNPGRLLSSKTLISLGNMSYSMYLVHWPIIVAYKYYYDLSLLSIGDTLNVFIMIYLVTLLLHFLYEAPIITFEKPLISSSTISALLTCIFCVGFICTTRASYLKYFNPSRTWKLGSDWQDEIISWNVQEYEKALYPHPCDPDNVTVTWTNYTDANPELRCQSYSNGLLKVLIIGNSIAYRAYPKLHEIFNGRYRELRLYARSASIPLANHPETYPEFTVAVHKVVEKMKPDIIWNIHVHEILDLVKPFSPGNKANDTIFLQFQDNVDFYSSHAKEMIIDLPYYWANVPVAYTIAKRFYLGQIKVQDLEIPRKQVEEQQIHHKARLLAVNCSNCRFNDVQQNFFDNDVYRLYNKNFHAYSNDGSHLTSEMLDRIAPIYRQVIEDLVKKYGT